MKNLYRNISTTLKNPHVQRVLAWALPLIIGWIMSRMDKKSKHNSKKK